jgi:hypothetical protein
MLSAAKTTPSFPDMQAPGCFCVQMLAALQHLLQAPIVMLSAASRAAAAAVQKGPALPAQAARPLRGRGLPVQLSATVSGT